MVTSTETRPKDLVLFGGIVLDIHAQAFDSKLQRGSSFPGQIAQVWFYVHGSNQGHPFAQRCHAMQWINTRIFSSVEFVRILHVKMLNLENLIVLDWAAQKAGAQCVLPTLLRCYRQTTRGCTTADCCWETQNSASGPPEDIR